MTSQDLPSNQKVGVFYMAWGARSDPLTPLRTFHDSYKRHRAGFDHDLCILFKGFRNASDLHAAQEVLAGTSYRAIFVDEKEWDIGSYFVGAAQTDFEAVVFLNTYSEILCHDWLLKIAINLALPNVGLVGCTGSYEAPQHHNVDDNSPFPNPHIRSNAFALRRDLFLRLKPKTQLYDKLSTHLFEHGSSSMTRRVATEGLKVLIAGRDGRGYAVEEWPSSRTFRQGTQANLLIADNRTRDYDLAPLPEKRVLFRMAWGDGSHGRVEVGGARSRFADEEFLHSVYQILLGRTPEYTEIKRWMSALDNKLTKEDLISMIRMSQEGQVRQSMDPYPHRLLPAIQMQEQKS